MCAQAWDYQREGKVWSLCTETWAIMGETQPTPKVDMSPADIRWGHIYNPSDPDLREGPLPAHLRSWRHGLAFKSSLFSSDSDIQNADNAAKADEACAPDTGKSLEYKIWGRVGKTSFLGQRRKS